MRVTRGVGMRATRGVGAARGVVAARTLVGRVVVAPADRTHRLEAGHVADFHVALQHAGDRTQQLGLVLGNQRDRLALRTVAAGAADAVHVIFGDHRQVEVDHGRQLVAVDADSWRQELPQLDEHYRSIGETVPTALREQLTALEKRLAGG